MIPLLVRRRRIAPASLRRTGLHMFTTCVHVRADGSGTSMVVGVRALSANGGRVEAVWAVFADTPTHARRRGGPARARANNQVRTCTAAVHSPRLHIRVCPLPRWKRVRTPPSYSSVPLLPLGMRALLRGGDSGSRILRNESGCTRKPSLPDAAPNQPIAALFRAALAACWRATALAPGGLAPPPAEALVGRVCKILRPRHPLARRSRRLRAGAPAIRALRRAGARHGAGLRGKHLGAGACAARFQAKCTRRATSVMMKPPHSSFSSSPHLCLRCVLFIQTK